MLDAPPSLPSACTPSPATFDDTVAGFDTVCSVRSCPAAAVANLVWSSYNSSVTRSEIETAFGMLVSTVPVTLTNVSAGVGNIMADGVFGQAAYGAGLLFKVTGDVRALDLALQFADNILADNILAVRNNPAAGKVLWTGNRELRRTLLFLVW